MNPSAERGKRAERELVGLLRDLTGWPIRRRLQNGRSDDTGDLEGLPDTCAQVKDFVDVLRAEREALAELEHQRARAQVPFAVAFVRHRGGRWVAVMTPEQFCTLLREATGP
jgi:Holliday junction resolvase